MSASRKKEIVRVGSIGIATKWGGQYLREQYTVLHPNGISISVTSLYPNHAWKVFVEK